LLLHILWVWDRKQEKDGLNHGPAIVAKSTKNTEHNEGAEGEPRGKPARCRAVITVGVEVNAIFADVSRDLAVSLGNLVVPKLLAHLALQLMQLEVFLLLGEV